MAAVKATLAPNSEGLAEEDTLVDVSAGFTICPPGSEPLLPLTSELLLVNTALMGWFPTARLEVGIAA